MRSSPENASEATAVKPMKLRRLGIRRLARAHLTLSERPRAARLAKQALGAVCEALSRELACPVRAEARLLEAVVMPMTGLAHRAAFALVDLSALGGTAVLELELPVLFAALERLAGSGTKSAPITELTRLEEASFAFLGLVALEALRGQGDMQRRFGPRLTGVTVSRTEALARLDARQRHLGVELTVTVGRTTAGGRLVLPAGVIHTAVQDLPVERDMELATEVGEARWQACCRVGCAGVSREALESLSKGDVILFERLRREEPRLFGPGRLMSRGFELKGDFTPEGFLLNRALVRGTLQEQDMATVVDARNEGMPPLPVDVEIELTRIALPISELARLKPGALLPLHIAASDPVLLRVGIGWWRARSRGHRGGGGGAHPHLAAMKGTLKRLSDLAAPRHKLMLAGALVVGLALLTSTQGLSVVTLARGVLVGVLLVGLGAGFMRRGRDGAGFTLAERMRVVSRAGLSPRCGLALVEVDGRSYLVAFGEGFARIQHARAPVRLKSRPRRRAVALARMKEGLS